MEKAKIKPVYKLFDGFDKNARKVSLELLPKYLYEGQSKIFGLEIWVGDMRTGRGFIELKRCKNRVHAISSFSDTDVNGEYLEGSSAISSVRSGNITPMVMSDNRLNSPFYLSHLPKFLQYKCEKKKTFFDRLREDDI